MQLKVVIFFPGFLPIHDKRQTSILESFAEVVGNYLKIPVTRCSIDELWAYNSPPEAENGSIRDYPNKTVAICSYVFAIWKKISAFCKAYEARFSKRPLLPVLQGAHLWDEAVCAIEEESKAAWGRISVCKECMLNRLLNYEGQNSLVVMSLGEVQPYCQDQWPPLPTEHQQLWDL